MSIPPSLSGIDEDDISLPLSLIKGLRCNHVRRHQPLGTSAVDSSSSSSDKDETEPSGGETTNTSFAGEPERRETSITRGAADALSSHAGSISKGGNIRFDFLSGDESSEKLVTRGKFMTSLPKSTVKDHSSSRAHVKVSFDVDCGNNDGAATSHHVHLKRKRNSVTGNNDHLSSAKISHDLPTELNNINSNQNLRADADFGNNIVESSRRKKPTTQNKASLLETKRSSNDSGPILLRGPAQGHHSNSATAVSYTSSTIEVDVRQEAGQVSSSSSHELNRVTGDHSRQNHNTQRPPTKTAENMPSGVLPREPPSDVTPKGPNSKSDLKKPKSCLNFPKKVDTSEERRLERNQREKERSNRIASQVDALRCLLQRGGMFIPKNTKSTVLSEASNYIRTLQDRQQLMSLEMEGLKRQLLAAMASSRHVQQPGQNVLPPVQDQENFPSATAPSFQSLPNTQTHGAFGLNIPQGSIASHSSEPNNGAGAMAPSGAISTPLTATSTVKKHDASDTEQDYHLIFKNAMAGMAVASMGGALLDCNVAFQSETGLLPDKIDGMTVFNIVHPSDLSRALELISQMIDCGYIATSNTGALVPNSNLAQTDSVDDGQKGSALVLDDPSASLTNGSRNHCVQPIMLRSSFRNRPDIGLCVTLVRGDDFIAKCFNITLVKNVASPSLVRSNRRIGDETDTTPFNPEMPSLPIMPPKASLPDAFSTSESNNNNLSERTEQQSTESPHSLDHEQTAGYPNGKKVATQNQPSQSITEANTLVGKMSMPSGNNTAARPASLMAPNTPLPTGVIPPQIIQLLIMSQQQQLHQHTPSTGTTSQQHFYPATQQTTPIQNQVTPENAQQGVSPTSTMPAISTHPRSVASHAGVVTENIKAGTPRNHSQHTDAEINCADTSQLPGGPAYYASG